MRTHLVACSALAVLTAVAILVQAEALSRLLPRLIRGDGSATAPLVAWLLADWVGSHGPVLTAILVLLPYVVFGVVAVGLYTWAVDGPPASADPA